MNLHGFYPRQAFHSHTKAVNRRFLRFVESNILIRQSENRRDNYIESDYFYNLILVNRHSLIVSRAVFTTDI